MSVAVTTRPIKTEAYRGFILTIFVTQGKPVIEEILALADESDSPIPSHWNLKETCDYGTRGWLEWSSEEPIADEDMERVRKVVEEIDNAIDKIRSKP